MNLKLGAKVAALVGGVALAATPALAQMHSGGGHMGGGHMGGGAHMGGGIRSGTVGGFHNGTWGAGGSWRGGTWRGGTWGGHRWWGGCCGFWGPGWGWWGDPFFWGGVGYVAGYELAPAYDDYYDDPYAEGAAPAYGGPPPGYDCDGWRWEPAQNRYVPAKVACN